MRQLESSAAMTLSDPKMASKMAAADFDVPRRDRRPSLVDLRNVLSLDDFEAFCVQASSGGSLYGMLRKQLSSSATGGVQETSAATGKRIPPGKRSMERQRSKSLIQRSVALSEEKSIIKFRSPRCHGNGRSLLVVTTWKRRSIIKLLCDYTETTKSKQRLLRDNRRHSEVYHGTDSSAV